jgi:2-polyprenyl-6-methoxyphenol hydroxylase-like FAD-dependent oxidoreductase
MRSLRVMTSIVNIAIIGSGPAGQTCAIGLARAGHRVTLMERTPALGGVGAGLLIGPTGQAVLGSLGLGEAFKRVAAPVRRLHGTNHRGRTVLDLRYADLRVGAAGLGVHRAALAGVLDLAITDTGLTKLFGVEVTSLAEDARAVRVVNACGTTIGAFDLVVVASGAHSALRRAAHPLVRRECTYPWGALWFIGPDPTGTLAGTLRQVYRGTRRMIGFLPSGRLDACGPELVSMFWSIPLRDWTGPDSFDFASWQREAILLAPFAREFLAQIQGPQHLIFASYSDVVMRAPHRGRIVFIGDAAHAMSPQLGQGANLGMMDGLTLAAALTRESHLPAALEAYAHQRRRHVRLYQSASRHLTPVFQSNLAPLGFVRDAFLGPACRFGPTRRIGLEMLAGTRTRWLASNRIRHELLTEPASD